MCCPQALRDPQCLLQPEQVSRGTESPLDWRAMRRAEIERSRAALACLPKIQYGANIMRIFITN